MFKDSLKVLVVDDEPKILEVLSSYVESLGYEVFTAEKGRAALEIMAQEDIGLVLLDLMLPDIPGEEVCVEIRKRSRVPVIMLTAKVEEEDMLKGLKIGADDYITKPFSLREVGARIEAVLRRTAQEPRPLYNKLSLGGGELEIDLDAHTVAKNGENITLTPNEFRILAAMMRYPQKVFTRDELIATALGDEYKGYDRGVDTHIKNLRKKIETDTRNPAYIKTVHGVGYKFGVD